jgi:hypothetical protein
MKILDYGDFSDKSTMRASSARDGYLLLIYLPGRKEKKGLLLNAKEKYFCTIRTCR